MYNGDFSFVSMDYQAAARFFLFRIADLYAYPHSFSTAPIDQCFSGVVQRKNKSFSEPVKRGG